jgi:hypothetical protein
MRLEDLLYDPLRRALVVDILDRYPPGPGQMGYLEPFLKSLMRGKDQGLRLKASESAGL